MSHTANGRRTRKMHSPLKPDYTRTHRQTGVSAQVYVGDCRELVPRIDECACGQVDLVFADPPFNWRRDYDRARRGGAWTDDMAEAGYCDIEDMWRPPGEARSFTMQWLDLCIAALAPHGSLWVNIPDDWAAQIVMHCKRRGLRLVNWNIWHYRFGQNTSSRFINSKVHVLYFCKSEERIWNPDTVLEISDRRAIYADARTESKKDGSPAGLRLPMDVWYGKYWGRIQGNNTERRHGHDNQLPEVYLARVIRATSNMGCLVMDPFLGSGTTGVIAHALGRDFIGCEYSEQNARQAWERIGQGPVRVSANGDEVQSTAIFPGRSTRRPRATPADAGEAAVT